MVRGHFVPFRLVFGLLLLLLVSVYSNHDCQLWTKCDISTFGSFIVWRKVKGIIKKLSLQRSVDLAILREVSLWIT